LPSPSGSITRRFMVECNTFDILKILPQKFFFYAEGKDAFHFLCILFFGTRMLPVLFPNIVSVLSECNIRNLIY
jgi:hypothetical protein